MALILTVTEQVHIDMFQFKHMGLSNSEIFERNGQFNEAYV